MTENENVVVREEEIIEEKQAIAENEVKEKKKSAFVKYMSDIWYGIIDSFKYNPCKLAGILIALPGLFIGFFLGFHSEVVFYTYEELDYSGILMFILVLMGCINIANGVIVASKRNLGSIISSAICSLVIVVCGVFWIERIFHSMNLVNSGTLTTVDGSTYELSFSTIMSISSVVLSIVCSVAGCIFGYIKRNKEYKKVKF